MQLYGRDREIAIVTSALADSATASQWITVSAPAGMGKSALLAHIAELAATRGALVLRCRPTAAERELGFAALGDLLGPVVDLVAVDEVPRQALEVALLRRRPDGPVETRAVGVAVAALVAALAADGPLLMCVDDEQWLDAESATALRYALRRLPDRGVLVVSAARTDADSSGAPPLDVRSRSPQPLMLAPLDDEALTALINRQRAAAGIRLLPAAVRAVVAAAGGNPLFAIELLAATATAADGGETATSTSTSTSASGLQVPATLAALMAQRWSVLSRAAVDDLAPLAFAARPDLALVERLDIEAAVTAAEAAQLLDTTDRTVRFTHPLLATALTDGASATRRRRWHAALASAVTDEVERARHLARAATHADVALSTTVAEASEAARQRGAIETAADLAADAARLCPLGDDAHPDRLVTAARLGFQNGDIDGARRWLTELDHHHPDRQPNAREAITRATIGFSADADARASVQWAQRALDAARDDLERAEAHALAARITYDHFPTAALHARRALELAERVHAGPAVLASALVGDAGARFMVGEGLDRAAFERAIELECGLAVPSGDSAFAALAANLKTSDALDEARQMLTALLADHDEGSLPFALSHLPQLELWSGRWDLAEDYANRHLDAAEQLGQDGQVLQAHTNLATIAAHRGDTERAEALATALVATARESGDPWSERSGLGMLGYAALARGDATLAVHELAQWNELGTRMGLGEPGYSRQRADFVEALLATGCVDEAAEIVAVMDAEAARLGRTTLCAVAARVGALVAATSGARDDAIALARRAVELAEQTPLVIEHARAQLTLGQVARRFKEKTAARDALTEALAAFERLGAERFAERTRRDLARVGLSPTRGTGLTDTERQVALAAATGRTVRQVGDELFMSPKTVESNLTRIYRKLGLSTRAELATWSADQR